MEYICDAPKNRTWFRLLSEGEALAESSPDAAIAAFEKAAQIIPNVRGEDSPNARIAALALKKNDKARAARALETLTSYDHTDVKAARQLVTLIDVKDVDEKTILVTWGVTGEIEFDLAGEPLAQKLGALVV